MIAGFVQLQNYVLIGLGILCGLLAIFMTFISFTSVRRKKILIKMELGASVLLFSDVLLKLLDGDMSPSSHWVTRISCFLVYVMYCALLYFTNEYITDAYMSTGKYKTLPKRLKVCFILPYVELVLVAISAFTGMIYYVDSANVYHRGAIHFISFLIPFVVIILQASFIIQNRKVVNNVFNASLICSGLIIIVCVILQIVLKEVYAIDFAISSIGIVVFAFAIIDLNQALIHAAYVEKETGLPNGHGYVSEVDRVINRSDITLYNSYYLDIVQMSRINNKYGKTNGDKVILGYANYLNENLDSDEIVARLGGNYFAALVKKSNTDKFLAMLEDIPVEIEIGNEKLTVHVKTAAGGYRIDERNIKAGIIIGKTSEAIAYAKNVAKKSIIFMDKELEKKILERKLFEETLIEALAKNEFLPYYQPKVDTAKNELCGCEALVRWKHNDELVPPFKFIPVMEKSELICKLDFLMLDMVCLDIKRWIESGLKPTVVSVNFSRKNLGNPILAEEIYNVVKKHEIPLDLIQIEITETLDEFPLSYLIGVVEALQRYGLTVAIDDFGTGSSSIALLKEVSFDVLKIDRSFVDYKNDKEMSLLGNIIQMAESIGISVIAEGVEQKEQIEKLREMGCTKVQGYIFDKPLDKETFEKRLKDSHYQA